MNRDISNLIDPSVQEYIYYNGLYLREPEYKPYIRARAISYEEVETPDEMLLAEISNFVLQDEEDRENLLNSMKESGDRLLLLRNTVQENLLVGVARLRYLAPDELFAVLGQVSLADQVRRHTYGEILLISGIYVERDPMIYDAEQLLLTEALSLAMAEDCGYAVWWGPCRPQTLDLLERQGFVQAEAVSGYPLLIVDMRSPVTLMQNILTTLKEPFSSDGQVLTAVGAAHAQLQRAIRGLYPGTLVLSLNAEVIYHRLVRKITELNGVPAEPTHPRVLGPLMCVPFGKILRGNAVPNTVTKTIHTDRVYSPDLSESTIEAFPNYASIPCQVRTIKSFDRPVILVDDLMHPGVRIKALDPVLRQEGVDIQLVLVGILSGYGRDLMSQQKRPVDSVYFLPSLRQWFVEATLYPFIGGNTVRRSRPPVPGLLPGINHILPYAVPPFAKECGEEAVFQLSRCCLESARDVIGTLEREYRALYGRNLTLGRLAEAVILPLCPDKGTCLGYDPNLAASVYLENDLEQLLRTHPRG